MNDDPNARPCASPAKNETTPEETPADAAAVQPVAGRRRRRQETRIRPAKP